MNIRMNIQRLVGVGSRLMSSLGLGAALWMAGAAQAAEPAVKAHWQKYETTFWYAGHTTVYSCDGIEDRLKSYLHDLGAKGTAKDLLVSATGCGPERVSRMISVRVRVSLPVAGEAEDTKDSVMATPTTVELKSNSNGGVGPGDCELLEQVRDRLLPDLKLKSAGDNLGCVPGQAGIGGRTLKVPALIASKEK